MHSGKIIDQSTVTLNWVPWLQLSAAPALKVLGRTEAKDFTILKILYNNGDAFGPGSMLIRLQALRSLTGIRADPYRVVTADFFHSVDSVDLSFCLNLDL